MASLKFKDLKARVSILAVAKELGYVYDRKEGMSQPHFYLKDTFGNTVDDINIKNPGDPAVQGFWRRHPGPGRRLKGDVIDFIIENKTAFTEYAVARNDIDLVNRVLSRMSNMEMSMAEVLRSTTGVSFERRDFRLDRWERFMGPDRYGLSILRKRGFSPEDVEMFSSSIEMVRHVSSTNRFTNLGFPFRVPGESDIMGYEIRGFGSYKSKAEGTDSHNACWQGYAGRGQLADSISMISHVHLAESAYDAMSYAVINRAHLNMDEHVFVSMGGQFSDAQVENLLRTYRGAKLHLHFDNDSAGMVMELRAIALANGHRLQVTPETGRTVFTVGDRTFSIQEGDVSTQEFLRQSGLSLSSIYIEKAPLPHKDWNDVLMAQAEMDIARGKPGEAEAVGRSAGMAR